MSHTMAAAKAQRKTKKNTARNRQVKERIKDAIKNLQQLVNGKKAAEAKAALPKFYKLLDKASRNHIIHQNKTRRLKSAWTKKMNIEIK